MMLEEDVDDDYFTPIASTSLANIFENSVQKEGKNENKSLKYKPRKPAEASLTPDDSKTSQCLYACILHGYEWVNDVYTSRGKLGFAILKIQKTNSCNLVLYDSNKKTLSNTRITTTLNIIVKGNVYISYYDDNNKYWTVCATEEENLQIIQLLQNLNINVKHLDDTVSGLPQPDNAKEIKTKPDLIEEKKENLESDTDSSVNRRTKKSILSRMANMGHSVLPSQTIITTGNSSDSSDSTDIKTSSKPFRHKPIKSLMKRVNDEKTLSGIHDTVDNTHKSVNEPKIDQNTATVPFYTYLMPTTNSNLIQPETSTPNEVNLLLSEQRVNSSEMRINVNRISDKMDTILEKISILGSQNKDSKETDFQMEVLKKLLNEYENKIKMYEDFIAKSSLNFPSHMTMTQSEQNKEEQYSYNDIKELKNKLTEFQKHIDDKNTEISNLNEEKNMLIYNLEAENNKQILRNEDLQCKVTQLTDLLDSKENDLVSALKKIEEITKSDNNYIQMKVKKLMNDTFRAIAINFDNNENYSGVTIKNIIATVIKQYTIGALKDIN